MTTIARLAVYGGPFVFFLWPTIRTAPTLGLSLSVAGAIVASLIVWKTEHMKVWPHQDELN